MSGILGTIQTGGDRINSNSFKTMLDGLHLRGPDTGGIWQDHNVRLGHRMLYTTPEAHSEKLPWHNEETDCVITSDSRLDNRQELIEIFGRNSFKMQTIPDSRIILQSYQKWGYTCQHHLIGDFSFAIWDIKKQLLFCARDFLGVKPFYYCSFDNVFLFCSESQVIAKHAGLPFNINEPRIADSLTPHLEGFDTTSTFYKEIFRLPPAHTLELKKGNVHINRYWQPEPQKENNYKTDDEYREELTDILTRAVADRCRGAKDPAILLSGGVDSATVMSLTRNYCRNDSSRGSVHSYSGISEDIEGCKESRMITLLSGKEDITAHLYTPQDLSKHEEPVFDRVSQIHEPFDVSMILHFLLYQQAAENGHRIMLDGVDGDVAASLPFSYPAALLLQFAFKTAWHETTSQCRNFYESSYSPYKLFARNFLTAFTPQRIKDYRWRLKLPAIVREFLADSVATDAFAKKTHLRERLRTFERIHRKPHLSFPHEVYLSQVQHPFLTVGLERYDRVASLFSIEPRHPLLDKRVINFYMNLPWNQFMREGWPKYLFRQAAEQHLPEEVCWRTDKEHVGWQFTQEMLDLKHNGILRKILSQYDIMHTIVKADLTFNRSRKETDNKISSQTKINTEVAGLALWLDNL